MLKSSLGKLIVSAAVFDDLLSLVLLSILTAIINTGSLPGGIELGLIIAKVFAFLAFVLLMGSIIVPPIARYVNGLGVDEIDFSFLLIITVIYSLVAEFLGLHFILGAFASGLFFSQHTVSKSVYKDLRKKVAAITTGFLAPIFFASIGLELNISAFVEVPLFLFVLILIAFIGKLVGAAVPAMILGVKQRDAWALGVAMSSRGAVELIIAGIALKAGLFDTSDNSVIVKNLFSAIVIVAIVTTLVAPIGLRLILSHRKNS